MPPITQNSKVALTLGTVVACVIALCAATWQVANTLNEIRNELAAIRSDLRGQWTVGDQERWAAKLERENRHVMNFRVPEVREGRPH